MPAKKTKKRRFITRNAHGPGRKVRRGVKVKRRLSRNR